MARFFRRRKFCRFTADGVKEIDYKDLETLKQYITETGKIVPSRITVHARGVPAPAVSGREAGALSCASAVHGPPQLGAGGD